MHHIRIKASPLQLSKLRNGHTVRITKGEGCNLIVSPESYHLASRAFAKKKGLNIALSPEEIAFNRNYSFLSPEEHMKSREQGIIPEDMPHHEGMGLFRKHKKGMKGKGWEDVFGKVVDVGAKVGEKALERYLAGDGIHKKHMKGKGWEDVVGKLIDVGAKVGEKSLDKYLSGKGVRHMKGKGWDDVGNKLMDVGLKVGEKALINYLAGGRIRGRGQAEDEATYRNLLKIQGGLRQIGKPIEALTGANPADIGEPIGQAIGDQFRDELRNFFGITSFGGKIKGRGLPESALEALHKAGMGSMHADQALDLLQQAGIHGRRALAPYTGVVEDILGPRSRGNGIKNHHLNLGGRQQLIGYHTPPALISQPLSANFQMQHFLPPQYQHHFITGHGLYA